MSDLIGTAESRLREGSVESASAWAMVAIAYELAEIKSLLAQLVERQDS